MQSDAEIKFMIWLPAPANYVKGHSVFVIRFLNMYPQLAAYYKALPRQTFDSPLTSNKSFCVTVVLLGCGWASSNRIKTLLLVASDQVLIWATNNSLALYFVTLAGKLHMTHRTTYLEGLEGGKTSLGICVFMFVTLCKTSSFLPIWPLNISFCEICRAEQKQACVKINVELFQLCWDDLFCGTWWLVLPW